MFRLFSLLCSGVALLALSGRAEVAVSDLFADRMVVQANQPVKVWGKAAPGEAVTVSFDAQSAKATTGADGKWKVELPAQKAGGPHTITIAGKNTITISDVLVGEVWVASGQSNMSMRVYPTPPWTIGVADYEREINEANYPEFRFFTVTNEGSEVEKDEIHGVWEVCSPQTVGNFAAVPYFFAEKLNTELKQPMGMIVSAVGATSIVQWMPTSEVAKLPDTQDGLELATKRNEAGKDKLAAYRASLPAYYEEARKDRPVPGKLTPHREPYKGYFGQPGGLYNAMIAPLLGYPIAGFIWWQGEGDSAMAGDYANALKALIASWRAGWQEPDAPFLIVQTGGRVPFPPKPTDPSKPAPVDPGENRIKLRFGQAAAADAVPNAALAVSCDLGHPNVHSPYKKPVGERLARAALKMTYDRGTENITGPLATTATAKDGAILIDFKNANGKLVSHSGGNLTNFEIAGADGKFIVANADIKGDKVVVSHANVKEPTTVRYGWSEFPFMSLYDESGLPARPFVRDIANPNAEAEAMKANAPGGGSAAAN